MNRRGDKEDVKGAELSLQTGQQEGKVGEAFLLLSSKPLDYK